MREDRTESPGRGLKYYASRILAGGGLAALLLLQPGQRPIPAARKEAPSPRLVDIYAGKNPVEGRQIYGKPLGDQSRFIEFDDIKQLQLSIYEKLKQEKAKADAQHKPFVVLLGHDHDMDRDTFLVMHLFMNAAKALGAKHTILERDSDEINFYSEEIAGLRSMVSNQSPSADAKDQALISGGVVAHTMAMMDQEARRTSKDVMDGKGVAVEHLMAWAAMIDDLRPIAGDPLRKEALEALRGLGEAKNKDEEKRFENEIHSDARERAMYDVIKNTATSEPDITFATYGLTHIAALKEYAERDGMYVYEANASNQLFDYGTLAPERAKAAHDVPSWIVPGRQLWFDAGTAHLAARMADVELQYHTGEISESDRNELLEKNGQLQHKLPGFLASTGVAP